MFPHKLGVKLTYLLCLHLFGLATSQEVGKTWPPANPCTYFSTNLTTEADPKTPISYCGASPGRYLLSGAVTQYQPELGTSVLLCWWVSQLLVIQAADAEPAAKAITIGCHDIGSPDVATVTLSPPPTVDAWCSTITMSYTPAPGYGEKPLSNLQYSYDPNPSQKLWRGCQGVSDDCYWDGRGPSYSCANATKFFADTFWVSFPLM